MNDILWRRLAYMLSPQLDLYRAIAPRVQGRRVLEVGFGTGFGTVQLASKANHVTALDVDGESVKFAARCLPLMNVRWAEGDVLTYDTVLGFDAVVMIEVIEHIDCKQKALGAAAALLNRDGTLYLSTPNARGAYRKNELHGQELTAAELRAALGELFRDVRLYDYRLTEEQTDATVLTPLVAVCKRGMQ